jgi:two-component system, LytTR family, sensor kinase
MHTHPLHVTMFLHFAGFLCGLALYGILLGLALRAGTLSRQPASPRTSRWWQCPGLGGTDPLPVLAGIAGVVWSAGALVVHGAADLGMVPPPIAPAVAAYAALGFLPAAAAHSALRPVASAGACRVLVGLAYSVSILAAILQAHAGFTGASLPSPAAMRVLTVGFVALAVPVIAVARRQALWRHALLVVALAVFAVSAVHLVDHRDFTSPFWLQVIGHHAAVPLAVAILLQDYPFAFGDLLLKRMLALGGLVGLALCGVLAVIWSPLFEVVHSDLDRPVVLGTLLVLVVAVALAYQQVRAWSSAFVDRVVLRRASPEAVLADVSRLASESEHVDTLVAGAGRLLSTALTAAETRWHLVAAPNASADARVVRAISTWDASSHLRTVTLEPDGRGAAVVIPTTDAPYHVALVGPLAGGRRFLSADVSLLREVAQVLAHRIDAIRMGHERFEQRWREEEMARLAVDAELRALRAQINPHFLFNALTTVGYLVRTSPDQAVRTLLRLTELLRRVLRSEDEVVTLAGELQLVEAYLEIEKARFEERLRVSIDVPEAVKHVKIPSFVLQLLVENAVKHGVAASRAGGTVSVTARLQPAADGAAGDRLVLIVSDTGGGGLADGHEGPGIGLANVRRRLELAYGDAASLNLADEANGGVRAVVVVPVAASQGERCARSPHATHEGRPS